MYTAAYKRSVFYQEWCYIGVISNYIISIVCAAAICGILTSFVSDKNGCGSIIRIISGVFLTVAAIAPLIHIKFTHTQFFFDDILQEAESITQEGTLLAKDEKNAFIKEYAEAYILDKANEMGVEITADVVVGSDEPMLPESVAIYGAVSPYNKKVLVTLIKNDLGIPEENQEWN